MKARRANRLGGCRPGRVAARLGLLACALGLVAAQAEEHEKPARLDISGYGFLGNRQLKRTLSILEVSGKSREFYSASSIEDAALVLRSRLNDDGYLQPVITATLTLEDGSRKEFVWHQKIEEPLPRPLRAREVDFQIEKGVRYHYTDLRFEGLSALPPKQARGYFVETGGLIHLKESSLYSPERLKRSVRNLADVLERLGFQNARVTVERLEADDATGATRVTIGVREGPKFFVRSVRQEIFVETRTAPSERRTNLFVRPYSKLWEQDFVQEIKTNLYRLGYPDTSVAMQTVHRETNAESVYLDFLAKVHSGARVKVGDIRFVGNERTKEAVLDRRIRLEEGDWLSPTRAERGRYRLSRLGVFDSVELKYEPVDEHTRDVIYELKEGKRIDVSVLFGYGSYELLRAGVEVEQFNVLGRAHHSRLRLIQSFKSSSADYTYTMPELLGENVDAFFTASGLRREEVSFTRLEYGGGAGVRKFYRNLDTDVSLRYNYQVLNATETSASIQREGASNPGVGALIADIHHDRRDNPLYPHKGYKIFSNIELASTFLAGDVNYQRLDLSGSYHRPLGESQWFHAGLSHGILATVGGSASDLPFTRRFFPGGENSIRGFREGEAAPRNAEGKIVGAETYTLGSLEFEQGITPKWSFVTFVDGVAFARRLDNFPGDEALATVGGGFQWKTLIGPLRIEYGYNLNPRPKDPTGTLHVSLGFPF